MRFLVFSDIHGNVQAMEAFMKQLRHLTYDKVVFLGDIFGYYYHQEECISILKSMSNLIWLKGNHDEYAVKSYYTEDDEKYLIFNYGHSYYDLNSRFEKETMCFLGNLKPSNVLTIDNRKFAFFHGSPNNVLEGRVYNDSAIDEDEVSLFDVVFVGHTHCKIDRIVGNTRIISPGSLGQPRDGKGYGYVIFDTDTNLCEFNNIEVDNDVLKSEIDRRDPYLKKLYDVLSREPYT